MLFLKSLSATLLLALGVSAHMEMTDPAPLGSQHNPNTPGASVNFNLNAPVSSSTFPCNVASFDSLVSGPGGKPVATWPAGSQQSFTISGGASHNGGSCQMSLSEDGGKTWIVIGSVIGGCPVDGKAFPFTVPKSAKSGKVLFAWTWFNFTGNREMYMNCAAVEISGGGNGVTGEKMFVANVPGVSTCTTREGVNIEFDPAKDCVGGSDAVGDGTGESANPTEPDPAPPKPDPSSSQGSGTISAPPTSTPPVNYGGQPAPTPSNPNNPTGFDDGKWYRGKYPGGKKVKRVRWVPRRRRSIVGGIL